jgi:hypothetical protein
MIVEFELSHEVKGTYVISEPEGWAGSLYVMERHPNFYSVNDYFKTPVNLYGKSDAAIIPVDGFREWVLDIEDEYGPNAIIKLKLRYGNHEFAAKKVLFSGQAPIVLMTEILDEDHTLQMAFTPDDFWATFLSRFQMEVDIQSPLDKDGNAATVYAPYSLGLKSQTISYNFQGALSVGSRFESNDDVVAGNFITAAVDTAEVDDFSQFSGRGYLYPLNGDNYNIFPAGWFIAPYDGEYAFDYKTSITYYEVGNLFPSSTLLNMWARHIKKDNTFTDYALGTANTFDYTEYTFNQTLNLLEGEEVLIFGTYNYDENDSGGGSDFDGGMIVWGIDNTALVTTPLPPVFVDPPTYLNINANTVYKETTTPAFFLHDVGSHIFDRILGGNRKLYSEYLGNPDTVRIYDNVGPGSLNMLAKVLHIRGYTLDDKKFFETAEKWWNGVNPHYNLGLGPATKVIDNSTQQVIEVEEKAKFFDSSNYSIILINVKDIERSYDQEHLFNVVESGSEEGEAEDVSGLDDTQKVTRSTIFKTFGKKLSLLSSFLSASITLESARRQRVEKSKDYKYDNKTAIINVVKDGVYIPRTLEGFDAVTNLLNSSSRYNIVLSPARAVLRWLNYINGGLQKYVGSLLKFDEGKGNYAMTSEMADNGQKESYGGNSLSESGDIEITSDFLFYPTPYKIKKHPLTADQVAHLQANRKLAIGVSQTDGNIVPFFIKYLEWDWVSGTADIIAWPKNPFRIKVYDNSAPPSTYIFDGSFEHGTFQ